MGHIWDEEYPIKADGTIDWDEVDRREFARQEWEDEEIGIPRQTEI